jgi:hypothetical protein
MMSLLLTQPYPIASNYPAGPVSRYAVRVMPAVRVTGPGQSLGAGARGRRAGMPAGGLPGALARRPRRVWTCARPALPNTPAL